MHTNVFLQILVAVNKADEFLYYEVWEDKLVDGKPVYIPEKDADGNDKVDENGNTVYQKDPNTGEFLKVQEKAYKPW